PFVPTEPTDAATVRAWCDACADLGRSERGTRHGGDLLFAAGEAARRTLRDAKRATQLFAEAAGAYPDADVTRGVLLVRWLAVELDRGNAPRATTLLERLGDVEALRPPRDATESELRRWEIWDLERRLKLPPQRARHLAAQGNAGEAARILEQLVRDEADALEAWLRLDYLVKAARHHYVAGSREGAVRALDAALELTEDDERTASLRFLRLYAKHGLLDEHGMPRVGREWPGEAFEDDLRAYLREIQGREGVGTRYLSLGSRAYAAGRYAIALEIYLLGLRDPELLAEARRKPTVWRGLLMGYSAAMRLERFDEAEQILEIVERIADEPMDDKDTFLLALQKARRDVAERPLRGAARRKLEEAKRKRKAREAERHRARMETGRREAGARAEDEVGLAPEAPEDDLPFGPLLGLVAALGLLAIFVLARRR
nr:hypothetical protein [Planctomycetota bacterium]